MVVVSYMMYNFIVVDDRKEFINIISKIIKKTSEKCEFKYSLTTFLDYNDEFYKTVYTYMKNKIYILDIEAPSANGIQVAEKITLTDKESTIIFVSAYEDAYLRFIVKCSANYYCSLSKTNLEVELAIKLENLIKRGIQKIINISSNNTLYQVIENDILYIMYEKGKILIVNENYSVSVNKQLNEMYKLLSNNFVYSHKACIVNMLQIADYSLITQEIVFKNGKKCNLISRKYVKDMDAFYQSEG